MIDEKALQAAIPVGSNIANEHMVRAIIEAYEAARSAEPVACNDETRDFWRQWAARRLEISRTHWLRASERALNGDMRELRLRVDQAKAPQAQIVASARPTPEAPDV